MMSEKVTLLMVQAMPSTLQTSLARSMSQPTRLPLRSTNSFGAYEASVAICNGAAALTAAGTSAAIVGCIAGPAAAEGVGVEEPPPFVEPPHAASSAAGNRSAIPARREKLTVRRMCAP